MLQNLRLSAVLQPITAIRKFAQSMAVWLIMIDVMGKQVFVRFQIKKNFEWIVDTVGTPYNTNVGVQKIPDRAIWKPVVAKRNNTNPWSCPEPQILMMHNSRQLHMAKQPASRDRLE